MMAESALDRKSQSAILVQHELFDSTPVLTWLDDETLFSFVSRHHYFWGNSSSETTAMQFFGGDRAGCHHDLPNHLLEFGSRLKLDAGALRKLCFERTVLKFYLPFLHEEVKDHAVASLCGHSVAHLKLRLGILTSRFRANHPLKACEHCMKEDGQPYWHLAHQFPGVWTCPRHGALLQVSTIKHNGLGRFQWCLPTPIHLSNPLREDLVPGVDSLSALERLSQLIVQFADGGIKVDTCQLYLIYRRELARRGWLKGESSLNLSVMTGEFFSHIKPLTAIPELSGLVPSSSIPQQFARLFRPPRSGTHPLRHIVIIHWLFGSYEHFFREHACGDSCEERRGAPAADLRDERRSAAIKALESGESARVAAAKARVDVATVMAWAAAAGILLARRPKKLRGKVRERAMEMLRGGADKPVVAAKVEVSIGSITRLLFTEVGLHRAWQQARLERARVKARTSWSNALEQFGSLGMSVVRSSVPAAHAWLHRNDKQWLDANKPVAVHRRVPDRFGVRWEERDQDISAQVRIAALAISRTSRDRKLRFVDLCQAVPDLCAKQRALEKLPLTRQAVWDALRPPTRSDHDLFLANGH